MRTLTTLKPLEFEEALQVVDAGGAFVDLRPIDQYLDVHIPGTIALLYERGPGMAARARDCVPLDLELVVDHPPNLSDDDVANAAAALRGKGFTVAGKVSDAINRWAKDRSVPASTEVLETSQPPPGTVLSVGDPGARSADSLSIPVEKLWSRIDEVPRSGRVLVIAGFGVRAALAVGILERHGFSDVAVWKAAPR